MHLLLKTARAKIRRDEDSPRDDDDDFFGLGKKNPFCLSRSRRVRRSRGASARRVATAGRPPPRALASRATCRLVCSPAARAASTRPVLGGAPRPPRSTRPRAASSSPRRGARGRDGDRARARVAPRRARRERSSRGQVDPDVADAAIELFADAFPRSALAIALRGPPERRAPAGSSRGVVARDRRTGGGGKENASGAADSGAAADEASSHATDEPAAPESEGASDPEAKPKPPYPPPRTLRTTTSRSSSASPPNRSATRASGPTARRRLLRRRARSLRAGPARGARVLRRARRREPPRSRDRHPIATPMGSHLIRRCAVPGISEWNAYVQDQCSYLYDDVVRTVDHFIERRQIVRASAKMALAPRRRRRGWRRW